jgi:hypothetical protein
MTNFARFAESYLEGFGVEESVERAWGKAAKNPRSAPTFGFKIQATRRSISGGLFVLKSIKSIFDIPTLADRPNAACIQSHLPTNRRATRQELYRAYRACVRKKAV